MKEIKAIIRPNMTAKVLDALRAIGEVPGCTLSEVHGYGKSFAESGGEHALDPYHKMKLELVVDDKLVDRVIKVISEAARTDAKGDGKIFVSDCEDVVRIRTGEHGRAAL